MFLLVPNDVRDLLQTVIDVALDGRPCTDEEREHIYSQLLVYYDEHGTVPDFELNPATPITGEPHETRI
jgi:hypothetical protein